MNKKTFLVALALGACSLGSYAQDKPTKMSIKFTDASASPSPLTLEKEHYLTPAEITHKIVNGKYYVTLHTRYFSEDYTVDYPLEYMELLTHLTGDAQIQLTTNQDPDHPGNYYTTFYSTLESYTLPDGVTAYTAERDGNVARLKEWKKSGYALPHRGAVLLHSTKAGGITMTVQPLGGDAGGDNIFSGVDLRTQTSDDASMPYHIFTYGHNGLGFYKKVDANQLLANKAFIHQPNSSSVSAFSLVFPDEEQTTGIDQSLLDEIAVPEGDIYSVSGVQLSKPMQGVNIVGGKKVLIK